MANLPKDLVQERKEFMVSLLLKNPGLTAQKANDLLAHKYGRRMCPNSVYEIRTRVRNHEPVTTARQLAEENRRNRKINRLVALGDDDDGDHED